MKEGRLLLLAVRETPLHPGHLRLMKLATRSGAVIFPPVPSFFSKPQSVDDVISNLAGRMLFRMGIENESYTRWKGDPESEPAASL